MSPAAPASSGPAAQGRRSLGRLLVIALGLAGALVCWSQYSRTWIISEATAAALLPGELKGSQVLAVLPAVALLTVACCVAIALAGPIPARLLGLVLVLAGAYTGWTALAVHSDPATATERAIASGGTSVLVDPVSAEPTSAALVTVAGGVLIALAGLSALGRAGAWRRPSSRFERAGTEPDAETGQKTGQSGATRRPDPREGTPIGMWQALDRGEDPTLADPEPAPGAGPRPAVEQDVEQTSSGEPGRPPRGAGQMPQ